MRRHPFLYLALSALVLTLAAPARAGDDLDEEQVAAYAVQSRLFRLGGELNVNAGLLPINAFNKGLTLGGSFTYHFSTAWAWEVVNVGYVYKQMDTGLKKELLENFDVQPTEIMAVDMIVSSSLVLKPFYGKFAVWNRRLIHADISVPIGIALARYTNPQSYQPGPLAGLILRVFLSPHLSLRIDARHHVLFNKLNTRNEFLTSLGLAYSWGGDER